MTAPDTTPGPRPAIAELRIRSGAHAGHVATFEPGEVRVGRAPECQLRFGPDRDLEVSNLHALLWWEDGAWRIRDLESRNGTFVNGGRIVAPTRLADGDELSFSPAGPRVEFRLGAAASARGLRLGPVFGVLAVALTVAVGALLHTSTRSRASWAAEREQLLARIDSILRQSEATVASLEGERAGLAEALRESQLRVREARLALERSESRGGGDIVALRRRLQAAEVALTRQQLAAALDTDAIERANADAVAVVYAEEPDGTAKTATGFAVRTDGTIVTARHVLEGEDGMVAVRRLAVQFARSDQVWPARVAAIDDEHDIAVIRVDNILGGVPTVQGLDRSGDAAAAGRPVAAIGYPLGGEPQWSGRARIVRPIVSVGVLLGATPARLEVQGYGASGASGSPIFAANGTVVGVLFGGRRTDDGQVLLAVPAPAVARLLARVP